MTRRGLEAWLTLALLLGLQACLEGYPSEDAAQTAPAQMDQTELLDALNTLGAGHHLAQRWSYALRAPCDLEVRVRGARRERVPLPGAELRTRSDNGAIEVLVLPAAPQPVPEVLVLRTPQWSDSVEARSLLQHLGASCEAEAKGD